jgi:hypothetical protein
MVNNVVDIGMNSHIDSIIESNAANSSHIDSLNVDNNDNFDNINDEHERKIIARVNEVSGNVDITGLCSTSNKWNEVKRMKLLREAVSGDAWNLEFPKY